MAATPWDDLAWWIFRIAINIWIRNGEGYHQFCGCIHTCIIVTTAGAFGSKTLTYLIFQRVLESQNVGLGSAGGVYAIILANIVAIFLMRMIGKNLDA